MRVAALQFDVREGEPEANLAAVERGLRDAAERGVALVVLPELWPTSFPGSGGTSETAADPDRFAATARALERLAELTRELELVVAGSAYGPPEPGGPGDSGDRGGLPTNRLHVFDRGALVLAYDKLHLFSPTAEGEQFRAGEEPPPVVDTSAGRLAGLVCYDLRFPELARHAFRAGAELLVCPAQWPDPRGPHWRALTVGRAVENQCVVVGANRTGQAIVGRRELELRFPGNSIVASPHGEVLAEGRGAAGLVLAEVDLEVVRRLRRRVPVARDERRDLYGRWGAPSERA